MVNGGVVVRLRLHRGEGVNVPFSMTRIRPLLHSAVFFTVVVQIRWPPHGDSLLKMQWGLPSFGWWLRLVGSWSGLSGCDICPPLLLSVWRRGVPPWRQPLAPSWRLLPPLVVQSVSNRGAATSYRLDQASRVGSGRVGSITDSLGP
ncbi:hypothetical protein CRG98_039987 [Punica granatum]|uniref:Uncharacterized protein n=1 Tax=Punica granatum TaxID=22663 RepID=A0A2I0I6B0_PUNGR|nr:hypothetical protein CRG98_039987 [Punica granatum]